MRYTIHMNSNAEQAIDKYEKFPEQKLFMGK